MTSKLSVCSQGKPVSYYWRCYVGEDHIEQTSSHVVTILREAGYVLRGDTALHCEVEIEDRLERAERGGLTPVEHVKRIQRTPEVDMFEIRWNHLKVLKQDLVSGLYTNAEVLIRLYYVEQGGPWVMGLHLHEKVIVDGDDAATSALQNEHIDRARVCFEHYGDADRGVDGPPPM